MERWTKCICLVIVFIQTLIEAYAYDFESNGVTYDIISATSLTCEVSGIADSTMNYVNIPETINYREREFKVIQIGENAFENSGIESILLPESITMIGKSAFEGSKLTQIEFPRLLQNIEERAFYNTLLKSVKLDFSSSCSIGRNSFSNCPSLELVNIGSNVELFNHNYVSDGDRSYGVFKDNNSLKSVNIEGELEKIPSYTFSDCNAIHDFNIIGKVNSIEGNTWTSPIDELNISGFVSRLGVVGSDDNELPCESLTISGRVTSVYGKFTSTLKEATLTGEIEYLGGFRDCNQLESLVIPNSVTSIGRFAGCSSLSHLVLSESISELEDKMFDGCTNLKELTIPSNVNVIKTGWIATPYSEADLVPWDVTSLIIKANPDNKTLSIRKTYGCRLNWLCPKLEKLVLERNIYDGNDDVNYRNSYNVLENFDNLTYIELANISDPINFGTLPSLTRITLRDKTPPQIRKSSFSNEQIMDVEIWVPYGYKEAYLSSDWGMFWNISELPEIKAEQVILSEDNIQLEVGNNATLSATILPEDASDKTVTWSSSDDNVVYIDNEGNLYALSIGKAIITASCGGASASCIVTVNPVLVETLTISPDCWSGEEGENFIIETMVLPEDATDKTLKFESDDESVAVVDQNGKVSVLKEGSCVITVSTMDGSDLTAKCYITGLADLGLMFSDTDINVDIYNQHGILLISNCNQEDFKQLQSGIYIIHTGSVVRKIVITNK